MTDEMLDETPQEESRQNPREDSVNAGETYTNLNF